MWIAAALGTFPPQARGWTRRREGGSKCATVSPAGAGMDPPRRLRSVDDRVSPAGAGMDRSATTAPPPGAGFPRRRGDGPKRREQAEEEAEFPPQARGWTPRTSYELPWLGVSPAGAGMDRTHRPEGQFRLCFPRRRGDGPMMAATQISATEFPPQARGWTRARSRRRRFPGVSPAGAGMDRRPGSARTASPGFPRRRGDGPSQNCPAIFGAMFPPQARGWTLGCPELPVRQSVSPAGAGMDRERPAGAERRPGFPRRRGDGPAPDARFALALAFPPQARGWTPHPGRSATAPAVSPAGAGMDPYRRAAGSA